MTKKTILLLFLSLFYFAFQAQDLSILTLPEKLTKNADAVVNYDELTIDLVSQDKMIIHRKVSITIFNKKANHLSELSLYYDNNSKVKSVHMEFFNLLGKRIKKVKKRDFKDYSVTGSSTLYSDNRALHYHYTATTYPYTVVYEYELKRSSTAFIPSWYPIDSYNIGVKKSQYTFTYPLDFKIQKLESNFENYDIKISESPGLKSYSIADIPPLKSEQMSPSFSKIVPHVKLASNKFHLAGVDGTADNWEDFGKWMYHDLLASRNNLSEETKNKIKEMVKGVSDPIERAKIIYEYVQNKTRYISIQVEIGGWQPMLADDVDKLGYGDCKALTFYTKSLMDVAEVPAIYTAVYAGESKRSLEKNVVSVQGNHVFLCLPREKDSIWLECTSQKVPFGYKNSFTDDRDVLAITSKGGKIIHTSTNPPEDNLQETTADLTITEDGSIKGNAKIYSFGTQYHDHLRRYEGKSPKDIDENMKEYLSFINNLNFSKIEVNNNKDQKRYEENIEFTAKNYGTLNADNSLLFYLNALDRISHVPDRVRNRKTPFEVLRGFKDVDNYTIKIPASYQLPTLPQPIKIENQFGIYKLSINKISDTSFSYKRSFLLNKGLYNKELYNDYRKFLKKIRKLENKKIIIHKK